MVQKEVKKKTTVYGTVAVLSAIILVTMVYSLGSVPLVFPPSQTPLVSGMKSFSSIDELKNFLTTNSQGASSFNGGPLDMQFFGSQPPIPAPAAQGAVGAIGATGPAGATGDSNAFQLTSTYSTTNVQVAGVDEADTVKTDGQYIYTVSTTQNSGYFYIGEGPQYNQENAVYIVNADPQNAKVVGKIVLDNNTEPAGLFLSPDGNRLVVLASKYQMYSYNSGSTYNPSTLMLAPYRSDVYTYVNVYDIQNKASPVLTRNFTVSGSYFNSRMIGNYIYTVVSQPAMVYNNAVTLPTVYQDQKEANMAPSAIYYTDANQSSYYTFTSFYGIDVSNDVSPPTNMTVMMDGASTMYVSPSNIYVTYPTWTDSGEYTSIYRVSINGLQLNFEAKGSVPGNTINQYAMDEYSGNFRIATNWQKESQLNNLYVLNQNLTVIGKLEGLAQGENLHSVRFMGDKCYLVTFVRTDPLFVIDLSQPSNPRVLGELKIPGYSDYLHPYDETHLIGVGKEAVDAPGQGFAWYQGIKLSLFDVSNVNNPVQLSNYVIGDRGTDSPVLNDPKAFLFDKSKNLLVIPIDLALVDNSTLQEMQKYGQSPDSAYGTTVWQGAYVFTLTADHGFQLKGTVTHLNPTQLDNQGHLTNTQDYWNTQNQWITRALYIGNTLYTISNSEVKLNSLTDLSQIAQINLQ
jgi:inhibitor of cysteine peptidase